MQRACSKTLGKSAWIVFILLFPGLCSICRGQQDNPRFSLPAASSDAVLSDSGIVTLIRRAKAIRYSDPDSAITLLTHTWVQSRKMKFTYGTAVSLLGLGALYIERGNYDRGLALLQHARPYCWRAGIAQNEALTVRWYNNMAMLFFLRGAYEESYRYFDTALVEFNRVHASDTAILAMIYANLGGVWQRLAEPDKALYYLDIGERVAKQIKDTAILVSVYNNKGTTLIQQGAYDDAMACFRKVISISEKRNKASSLQIAYVNIGDIYRQQGDNDNAVAWLKKALALSGTTNPFNGRVAPYMYLSRIYLSQQHYEQAAYYAKKILETAQSLASRNSMLNAYELLALANAGAGRYADAYRYLERYRRLQDSILNKERIAAVNQLEVKYRTAEKDRQLSRQQLLLVRQDNALRERTFWMWSIALGSLLLTVLFISLYRSNRHRQMLQAERIRNMEKDREIERLQAVMQGEEQERARIARELHDGIVSQLLAVKLNFADIFHRHSVIQKELFEQGMDFLEETTQELRRTTHNLLPETVLKEGLVLSLEDYCRKMSRDDKTAIHFMVLGDVCRLDPALELSLYRMVQELVQNALKHAHATRILVQVSFQDHLLGITVDDNGDGFDPEHTEQQGGIGIANIRARLSMMNGHMDFITSPGNGTAVCLEIPLSRRQPENAYAYQSSHH